MGVLDDSENHTPLSLTPGGDDSSPMLGQPSPDADGATDGCYNNDAFSMDGEDEEEELPFASVLNTVIDSYMSDPSPFEPNEFETRKPNTKVPILRVFGPIVRQASLQEPLQSACLYIHGAFPYLLARPRAAGPDASSQPCPLTSVVDWDSAESVQAILPQLQTTLEETLQAAMAQQDQTAATITTIIRQVTVVMGRGFYTYCPGKVAPFIRIQYFDPKVRWRVKQALERGLEVPRAFHPDSMQYDFKEQPSSDETTTALSFHCFEAHIPYTMQFFKDFNLAGMSYIHCASSGTKFRSPLPHKARPRVHNQQQSVPFNTDMGRLFCQNNTPLHNRWSNDTASTTRKETSCDVELDIHVTDILNVNTILTEPSSCPDVHWRAVPSLREVWRQERRRMAQLLPPKDDFLSVSSPPPFTLNVKKDASLSGTRLAVQGMKRLVRVSVGLEEEFIRCLKQIVHRHVNAVQRADQQQLELLQQANATTRPDATVDDIQALEALEGFGDQFVQEESQVLVPSQSSASDWDAQVFSQQVERGESVLPMSDYKNMEDFIDPATLTPFGDDDDDCMDDDEAEMSERDFEKNLTMLTTQMMRENDNEAASASVILPQPSLDNDDLEDDDSDDCDELMLDMNQQSDQVMPSSSSVEETPLSTHTPSGTETRLSSNGAHLDFLGKRVAPFDGPPSRVELSSGKALLPMVGKGMGPPSWLKHTARYSTSRKRLVAEGTVNASFAELRFDQGPFLVVPVSRPPSRIAVEKWCKKQARLLPERRKLHEKKGKLPSKFAGVNLEIDGNSRKLTAVPSASGKRKRDDLSSPSKAQTIEVEEIEWEASQAALSQSQTQNSHCHDETFLSQAQLPSLPENPQEGSVTASPKLSAPISSYSESQDSSTPALEGIGQQGGRIYVEGGGGLKSKTKSRSPSKSQLSKSQSRQNLSSLDLVTPLTIMSIEIHVQCRTGRAGVNDSKEIAMRPNSEKDAVSAVVFVYAKDPGGGEALRVLERGCLFVPFESESRNKPSGENQRGLSQQMQSALQRNTLGVSSKMTVEAVRDERHLLLRFSSIVRWKDPDMLISWDPQGGGLGYLIERGVNLGKKVDPRASPDKPKPNLEVDLIRLLGRLPTAKKDPEGKKPFLDMSKNASNDPKEIDKTKGEGNTMEEKSQFKGSGLGADWDERVGAGAAAASIAGRLVFSGWKLISEEVKHPNASYLPAMASTVLAKRIPHHDDLTLTQWYACERGRQRWRALNHRLVQCVCLVQMLDSLDIVGRAGEAARLSGVEFSQSFPGIRGSQYKVEGVLLRALKSIRSDERGMKNGVIRTSVNESKSLSSESKSQTQSPWKIRRGLHPSTAKDDDGHSSHDVSERCYFFYSPGINDTNNQEALECQALTLEPQSGVQHDPVVVCDFTALYPSLVIAYNLCYSTCAGKLDYHSTRREMRREGKTTGKLGPYQYPERRTASVLHHHLKSIESEDTNSQGGDGDKKDRAYVSPTGTLYVAESVLKGVLPQVLDELLSTRAMLKRAAKHYKKLVPDLSPAVLRQLEARQLALKYVANVTYGYTSATFSGRCAMPLLADTIVECGRRTLTNAMNLANEWGRQQDGPWSGAEVIYGDTDSVFVRLPGRTVAEAFRFGEAFCSAVTSSNPPPVQLKLEKVYQGSMMQTKKKYCGMKYDSKDQRKPNFEAKGIETIRRDQCALTQKVLRNALIALFRHGIHAVKSYLFRQWTLIMAGQLPISDFILTGRVRSKYRGGRVGPVQAVLARRLAEADPGRVVRHKERIAYIIVATPGLTFRLRDCVLTPNELLEQWDAYTIHSAYYITKHVNAALQRCLCLAPYNVDVNAWFEACPKPRKRIHHWPVTRSGSNVMISSYFGSDICSLCGAKCKAHGSSRAVVCSTCRSDGVKASVMAMAKLNIAESKAKDIAAKCSACNGCFEDASTFASLKAKTGESHQKSAGPFGTLGNKSSNVGGIVTPIANCICIDCPNTFERHRARETMMEGEAICKALGLI